MGQVHNNVVKGISSHVFQEARAQARWRKDTHVVRASLSPSSAARTQKSMMGYASYEAKGPSYEGSWISSAHDALRRAGLEVKNQPSGGSTLEPQSGLRMRKGRKTRRILNRRFTRHMGRRSSLMMAPLETHLDARRVQHTLTHTPYVRETGHESGSTLPASPYWSVQMPWSHDVMWRPRPLTRGGGWWWSHLRTPSLKGEGDQNTWVPLAYRMRPTPTGQVRMNMGYAHLAWSRMVKMARKGFPVMGRLLNRVRRGYSIGVYGRAGFLPFKTVSPFMMDRQIQASSHGLEGACAHDMETMGWGQGQRLYSILHLNHPRKTPTLSAVEPYVKIRTQWAPLSQRLHSETSSTEPMMSGEIVGRTLKEWMGSHTPSPSLRGSSLGGLTSLTGVSSGGSSKGGSSKGMWVLTSTGERICVYALGQGHWNVQWVEAHFAWSQRARRAGLSQSVIQSVRSCPLMPLKSSSKGQEVRLDVRALTSEEGKAWEAACAQDKGLEREACAYRLKEQGWGDQLARTGGGFLSNSSSREDTRLEAPSVLAQELRQFMSMAGTSSDSLSDDSMKGVRSVGGFNPRTVHDVPSLMWTRAPHPMMSILEGGLGVKRVRRRGLTPSTSRARFVALQHLLRGWTVSSLVEGAGSSSVSMSSHVRTGDMVEGFMPQGKDATMVLPSYVGVYQRGRYVSMHDDRMLGALRSVAHYSDKVRRELRARSYFESGVRTCPTLQREMWMRALTTRERRTIQSLKRVLGYGPSRRFETPSQVLPTTAPVRGLDAMVQTQK